MISGEQEIGKLRFTIQRFKEYDEERKKYYSEAIQRLGALEAFVDEIDYENNNHLASRLANLMTENRRLKLIIEAQGYTGNLSASEEEYALLLKKNAALKARNEKLQQKYNSAEACRDKAIAQLGELKRKYDKLKDKR